MESIWERLGEKARWHSLVRNVARATRSPVNDSDLLHSAVVRLAETPGHLQVRDLEAYLMRSAINLARDAERRERVHDNLHIDLGQFLADMASEPLQDERIAMQERLRLVAQVIETMSPRVREVFLLRRIEGLRYREIANRLGISVSAVEKCVAKAIFILNRDTADL